MTYTYRCNCKNEFEVEKGINEDVEVRCNKCDSKDVERIYRPIDNIWRCPGAFGKSK